MSRGRPSARADEDRYAFYRGTQSLGHVVQRQSEGEPSDAVAVPAPEMNKEQELLLNLIDTN